VKPIETRIYEANRAKEVLENPAFIAAFDDTENEVLEQWKNSPARDAEGRERLWTYLCLLRKVKAHLSTSLDTGRLAELELKHRNSLAEKIGIVSSKLW
jgi:hypothetical protein